ncbi:MAG: chorismate mutase [Robiginitomaculum sp.]|nr:MAG: chorismate mutase [Robiginitomaculum sp.]
MTKTTPMLKTAHECETMVDVRAEVDRLDRELVALITERQSYMEAAARIKTNRESVYDAARIEDVVSKVKAFALTSGLSTDIAEPVWRELIKQSIAHEFKAWDKQRGVS